MAGIQPLSISPEEEEEVNVSAALNEASEATQEENSHSSVSDNADSVDLTPSLLKCESSICLGFENDIKLDRISIKKKVTEMTRSEFLNYQKQLNILEKNAEEERQTMKVIKLY